MNPVSGCAVCHATSMSLPSMMGFCDTTEAAAARSLPVLAIACGARPSCAWLAEAMTSASATDDGAMTGFAKIVFTRMKRMKRKRQDTTGSQHDDQADSRGTHARDSRGILYRVQRTRIWFSRECVQERAVYRASNKKARCP